MNEDIDYEKLKLELSKLSNPTTAQEYFERGMIYYNNQFDIEAYEDFNKAFDMESKNTNYYYYFLMSASHLMFLGEIVVDLHDEIKCTPKKIFQVLKQPNKHRILLLCSSQLYMETCNDFIKDLSELLKYDNLTEEMIYNCHLIRAKLYLQKLEYNLAKQDLQKCRSININNSELYSLIGIYFYLNNNNSSAIECFKNALKLDRKFDYYKWLYEICFQEGKIKECFYYIDKAIELEGKEISSSLTKAIYLLEFGNIKEAFDILKEYYRNSFDGNNSIYYLVQALVFSQNKKCNTSEILNFAEKLYQKDMKKLFNKKLKFYNENIDSLSNGEKIKSILSNSNSINTFEIILSVENYLENNDKDKLNAYCINEYNELNNRRNCFWELFKDDNYQN